MINCDDFYIDVEWFEDSTVSANGQSVELSNSQCKRDSFKPAYRTPPFIQTVYADAHAQKTPDTFHPRQKAQSRDPQGPNR